MYHQPVQTPDRHFSSKDLYVRIDWNRLDSIVPAFMNRITDWYIGPGSLLAAEWHHAFSVMAINCLLIDTLSQFEAGVAEGTPQLYVNYVKAKLPEFDADFLAPIRRQTRPDMTNGAQVLYAAFRCGIVHEAHIPPYVGIRPEPNIVSYEAAGHATYANGDPCTAVFVDPIRLFRRLEDIFQEYIVQLLTPNAAYDHLRAMFKQKFTSSYGIDITNAV